MRLDVTKLLGRFDPQINIKFVFNNKLSIDLFLNLKTKFLISHKVVSSVRVPVDSLLPHTLARALASYRHAMQKMMEYPLGQVNLYQINLTALYTIRDEIKSSSFSVVHKSERSSTIVSERILIKKLNFELSNQDAFTKLTFLGLYESTRKLYMKKKPFKLLYIII